MTVFNEDIGEHQYYRDYVRARPGLSAYKTSPLMQEYRSGVHMGSINMAIEDSDNFVTGNLN